MPIEEYSISFMCFNGRFTSKERGGERLNLNKKRSLIIVVTVMIAAFLIGSMATAVNSADDDNPLDQLWERLLGLEGDVDDISDEVTALKEESELLERLHELEIRLAVLERCGCESDCPFPEPDYDSNWISIDKGQGLTLTHDLNTTEYFVYLVGRYDTTEDETSDDFITGEDNFHTYEIGGDWSYDTIYGSMEMRGIWYVAHKNSIRIDRGAHDPFSDYVRVRIWKLP
jgi:hypothetical protein